MPENNNSTAVFLNKLENLLHRDESFKMTFSKQRSFNREIINTYIKPSVIKNKIQYSVTYRYKTRDEVKNFEKDMLMNVVTDLLTNLYYNADLFTQDKQWTLLQSKKGKSSLLSKNVQNELKIETGHDHFKERYIPENSPYLFDLGLSSKDGKIFDKSQDKYRQINKFIEIIDHILKDYPKDKLINIADMGSGKGYLTFALYDYLVNTLNLKCRITGYEIREDIVSLCYNTAIKVGYIGLTFQQKSIQEVNAAETNMIIALHACDIATDMAISKGILSNAEFIIVSPCCHKQIRQSMHYQNELSPILKHGILEERMAEIITDGIRALLMEANGYKTQVFEFISSEHTGKNLMITGVRRSPNPTALNEVNLIKNKFGIDFHYLEKLLPPTI